MKNINQIILLFLFCIGTVTAQISASWKSTGPVKFPTINNSGQINGIGRVSQIKFHPTDPNKMYAVSASGGLFISSNLGANWQVTPGTDKLPGTSCASVCIDHTNDQVLYLGTGDANYYYTSYGLYKSIDGGNTWNPSNTGIGNRLVHNILMDPANNQVLIAATNDGVWKTSNAGASWVVTKSGGQFTDMDFNPNNPNIIYAATSTDYFRSTDMGTTWAQITLPASNSGEGRIGVTKANTNIVYLTFVGDYNSGKSTPVYKSTDAGLTFTTVKPANSYNMDGYTENQSGQGGYNYDITVDPLNAGNVWVIGHCVFKSTNGGVSWNRLTSWPSILHTDMHQITYSPHDATKLFTCNDGGVWINTDAGAGANWTPKSDGLSATECYHAGQSPIKKDRIDAGTQDNGEIYYNGSTWYTNRGGDFSDFSSFDYLHTDWIYYLGNGNTGNRRTGLAGNIQGLSFPFTATSSTLLEFTPLATNTAFLTNDNVWRTDNLSSNPPTWNKISGFNETVKAICISPVDANVVYVVTSSGKVFRSDNALAAIPLFTNISTAPSSVSSKASLAVMKANPNIVYMSCNSKVYRSADKGITWTSVSTGLPNTNFIKMYHDVYSSNEGLYIANGMSGVYYKNSGLGSWVNYSQGLPTIVNVNDFMIFNDGNYANSVLRVSYYGRGVWETPLVSPTPGPLPVFSANNTSVCPGNAITFNDQSLYNPTSWNWTFNGGIPASSTLQNPTVVYNTAGTYPVSLSVSNTQGSNSITQTAYITVSSSAQLSPTVGVISQSSFYPGQDAGMVFDNDMNTIWHNDWGNNAPLPHTLVFNLGLAYDIQGLNFLNRQDLSNGYPKDIELSTSTDNISWSTPMAFTLANTVSWQALNFSGSNAKYFKIKVLSTIPGTNVCSIAEIKLKGCPANTTGIVSETIAEADLQIYPNPNSGSFDVNIHLPQEENGNIIITDVLGRTVFQDEINTNVYAKKINLKEKGMYFVTVITGNNKLVKKVMVE